MSPKIRRAVRAAAGQVGSCYPLVVIPGDSPPHLKGRSWHWTTPNGNVCRYPNAYRRAFGKPIYMKSTLHIEVGQEFIDYLKGVVK